GATRSGAARSCTGSLWAASCHLPGRAFDRAQDPDMGAATAEILRKRRADLLLGRLACRPQECGRLHDHAVDAVTTLHGLLGDERLLQGMRLGGRAEALERYHMPACD